MTYHCNIATWSSPKLSSGSLSLQYATTVNRYSIITRALGCCYIMWPGVQGKSGIGMYNQFEKERDQGNFELLPELHAILSGMKVLISFLCTLHLLETAQVSYSHKITVIIGMIARAMDCSLQVAGADREQMMVFPCLLNCPCQNCCPL